MKEKPWLEHYDEGVPAEIDAARVLPLPQLLEAMAKRYPNKVALEFLGKS